MLLFLGAADGSLIRLVRWETRLNPESPYLSPFFRSRSRDRSRRDRSRERSRRRSPTPASSSDDGRDVDPQKVAEKAERIARHLQKHSTAAVAGYGDLSRFGDPNITQRFVWKKKIEKELTKSDVDIQVRVLVARVSFTRHPLTIPSRPSGHHS